MKLFEERFAMLLGELSPQTQEIVSHIPFGKRLRAKLIAMIAGDTPQSVDLACVVELIHAASLLHDDVIDDALTRRGVPSINALFDNKTSIMVGDILYSHAFSKLPPLGENISKEVATAVVRLSEGELADVMLSKSFNTNEALYLEMIGNKTAALIEASASCAGHLAGYDTKALGRYGELVGIAFQIIDDLLDITSDEKTLGKPVMNDISEGKTTLPYMYLYEKFDSVEREKLLSLFKKGLTEDEKLWVKTQMEQKGVFTQSITMVKSLCDEAVGIVNNLDVSTATKENLIAMVGMMSQRVY
jgi:octaprenyl-diphosphate synthase